MKDLREEIDLFGHKIEKPKPKRCYNCVHATEGFKVGKLTHHHCDHEKHHKGLENGELTAWDTLRVFSDTCEDHEKKS